MHVFYVILYLYKSLQRLILSNILIFVKRTPYIFGANYEFASESNVSLFILVGNC